MAKSDDAAPAQGQRAKGRLLERKQKSPKEANKLMEPTPYSRGSS